MNTLRSRITPIPLRRVVRQHQLTGFTRWELLRERAAWLVFGIGLGALVALFLNGCASPAEGLGPLERFADSFAGTCDYAGNYTLTLTPTDPACGESLVVHDDGREVGACDWTINGQPGQVRCDASEHPVERCEGATLRDDGCWYAVAYRREVAP